MHWWLRRLVIVAVLVGAGLIVGVHLELIRVTADGIRILHEEELTPEQTLNRADLYFRFFKHNDALRLYCLALFQEKPGYKRGFEYKPQPGEVDLERIADDYRLDDLAKRIPKVPQALFNIAMCYIKDGKTKEAMMVYKAFMTLFPNDPLSPMVDRNMEDIRLNRL